MSRKHQGGRRALLIIISFIVGAAVMLGVFALGWDSIFDGLPELGSARRYGAVQADADSALLLMEAYTALEYIRDGDYHALSRLAHPELGVLFAPYATISPSANRRFMPSKLASFDSDSEVYVWGIFDGSGEPIELTPSEYFSRFVFDKDYTAAPTVGIDYIVKSGNSLENITEIMPGARFVDFHIPATDEGGMDWSSLRLGFEEYGGELRLTFIGHSQWTV